MLNKYTRIFIMIVAIMASIVAALNKIWVLTVLGVVVFAYMLFAYFKYASVSLAFKKIRKRELKSAYNLLIDTPNPRLLSRGGKTYYYWAMGVIKISENKLDEAEVEFYNALKYGVTTANNMVIINLSLAQLCMQKEEYDKASVYLEEARKIPHKAQLDFILIELEDRLHKLEVQELLPEAIKPISFV